MRWLHTGGFLDLSEPRYLGILNLTPDSFSDGGRFQAPAVAVVQAETLRRGGAALLDLGAESTRPGAAPVTEAEEWKRLEPVLSALSESPIRLPLSLDCRRGGVARRALTRGVTVLNDVEGFRDPAMLDLALRGDCGLLAMRSTVVEGRLWMPPYEEPGRGLGPLIQELRDLKARLLGSGIPPERLVLDPGFGFGTTHEDDQALWEALPRLPELIDWPRERFCLGISRKRFIAHREGEPLLPPAQRDPGTHRAHLEALTLGFRLFRSHSLPPPRVRSATLVDCLAIARVQVAAWQRGYQDILPGSLLAALAPEQEAFRCREQLQRGPDRLRVLERASRIQGFAAISAGGDPPELEAIYLDPHAWGLGLGRLLHDEALAEFRRRGACTVRLWVLERNLRAQAFFQRQGWSADGDHRTSWHQGIALRERAFRIAL